MAIQSVRGMPDILPEQAGAWRYLEQQAQQIFDSIWFDANPHSNC